MKSSFNNSLSFFKSTFFLQDNDEIDEKICVSNKNCWGDGVCDPVMNNTKHCFDGGDCNYHYAMNYREPCKDYECCSSAPMDNCGMFNFIYVCYLLTTRTANFYSSTLIDIRQSRDSYTSIRIFIPCTAFETESCIWTYFGEVDLNCFCSKIVINCNQCGTHLLQLNFQNYFQEHNMDLQEYSMVLIQMDPCPINYNWLWKFLLVSIIKVCYSLHTVILEYFNIKE